jgi:hypothetical protein
LYENSTCDKNPNFQSHHPRPDTGIAAASDQILKILMENHSESLKEKERDSRSSRDSRAGQALLPKHLSDAKPFRPNLCGQFINWQFLHKKVKHVYL